MLLLVLATLAATTLEPAAAEPVNKPAAAAKANKDGGMVCRTEIVVGTRFPQKVCRNKEQAAQKQQDDQQRIRSQQQGPLIR